MKLHTLISAVLLAAASSFSTAYAADADKADSPKAQEKAAAPKAADSAPAEKADKAKPKKHDKTKDKTRHLHPRDGK